MENCLGHFFPLVFGIGSQRQFCVLFDLLTHFHLAVLPSFHPWWPTSFLCASSAVPPSSIFSNTM